MNYKLNKIYKINSTDLLLNIYYNCNEYNIFINENNLRYLDKSLKKKSISEAIKSWKKYETKTKVKRKREINKTLFANILNDYGIDYHFIGQYLVSLNFKNKGYIIDLINDSIENCEMLDSYENTEIQKSDNYSLSETDTEVEESVNVIKKIEKINLENNIPSDLKKLLNLTMNNTEILKPVLNLLNSKTDNFIGNIIKSSGMDINLDNSKEPSEVIKEITSHLKTIEDLNNNDISFINPDENVKFNFIVSEIWNQLKKIIFCLNKLSENDNYDVMLKNYQDKLSLIGFSESIQFDNKLLKNIVDTYLNNIINKLLTNYHLFMESKYLELNILLQNYDENKDNKILDSKLDNVINTNLLLFNYYFKNIYQEEDARNIFSEYNKLIKFSNILNSLNSKAQEYLILKLSTQKINDNKNIFNNLKESIKSNFENDFTNKDKINIGKNYENVLKNSYDNYSGLINIILPTFNLFETKVKTLYQKELLTNKKRELSEVLIKFHEEIKFKLCIINKVIKNH